MRTLPLRRGEGPALSPLRGEGDARAVSSTFKHVGARRELIDTPGRSKGDIGYALPNVRYDAHGISTRYRRAARC
jgi:hypothetical protein